MSKRAWKAAVRAGSVLAILMLLVPLVSASVDSTTIPASTAPDAQDSPDLIAAVKEHVAYVGEMQDARMDGVIQYIGNISGGTATTSLEEIRDDYLVIAASIPLMSSYAAIAKARDDLRTQTQLFSEETKAQMVNFNGSDTDMRASIGSSTEAAEKAVSGEDNTLWLANDSARLTLFNRASGQRSLVLRGMDREGIDISTARNISLQIDAQRADLQAALMNNSAVALQSANDAIKSLTRDFRKNVAASKGARAILEKSAAMMAMK